MRLSARVKPPARADNEIAGGSTLSKEKIA